MREIKFRAWDAKLKKIFPIHRMEFSKIDNEIKWISGVDIHDKESGFDGDVSYGGSATTLTGNPLVKRFHLMQYTGLTNRNGKEIYESSVVRDVKGDIFQVVWDDKHAMFIGKCVNQTLKIGQNEEYDTRLYDGLEVIGNIYEHPELLEG